MMKEKAPSKRAADRKQQIIETADELFRKNGYENTSVDTIIEAIGVAKGTYYYYFKSKQDILNAIVENQLDQLVTTVEQVASDSSKDALTKMRLLLADSHIGDEDMEEIADQLHKPANRELHEITNVQTVLKLSEPFSQIVEQGNAEGVFDASRPLETMQFLLAGGQFLLDGDMFNFSDQEIKERRLAMQDIIEKSLGAAPGSFDFMNNKGKKKG
jgi:AcrR family transcriptional regulator